MTRSLPTKAATMEIWHDMAKPLMSLSMWGVKC
ncbi:hypothetical protein F383_14100 [Gossypium arboreum]|uniref:Uncharacterized protein n=1 Tax=Gossypium arboreum TaxID=29729 RepID=A0A0B0NI41_GOSAR|nr:hypothetical protein F383_14100 [Gossypium arboreum]